VTVTPEIEGPAIEVVYKMIGDWLPDMPMKTSGMKHHQDGSVGAIIRTKMVHGNLHVIARGDHEWIGHIA
jgi:hypothetical protein